MEGVEVKKIEPAFVDTRGTISDVLEKDIKYIGLITCKTGSVRGKHYHKKQDQYMYIVKGKIEMKTKDLREKIPKVETRIIKEGDVVSIPAMIVHTFIALEDTTFIHMETAARTGNKYEEDTYRVEL